MLEAVQPLPKEIPVPGPRTHNAKYPTKGVLQRLNRLAVDRGYSRYIQDCRIEQSKRNAFPVIGHYHVTIRGTACVRCRVRLDHGSDHESWLDLPVDSFLALPDAPG